MKKLYFLFGLSLAIILALLVFSANVYGMKHRDSIDIDPIGLLSVQTAPPPSPAVDLSNNPSMEDEVIWFRWATLEDNDPLPAPITPELEFKDFKRDFGYYIVKFDGETTEERKEQIINAAKGTPLGAQIFYYVPNRAWIFRLSKETLPKVESLDFVKRVLPLIPSFRVRPSLLTDEQKPDPDGLIELKIQVFQGDDHEALATELRALGGQIDDVTRGVGHEYVRLKCSPENLRQIVLTAALFEGVEWVERKYPVKLLNDWSRWITQSYNFTGMTSSSRLYGQMSVDLAHVPIYRRNLYGQGQLVGYLDSGLDTNSIYFCDPGVVVPKYTGWTPPTDTGHRKIRAYNRGSTTTGDFDDTDVSLVGHGTHVGGSIAGENEANSPTSGTYNSGDGMAPLARLVFTDGAYGTAGIYTPTDMNTLFGYAQNCGAYIHSNSYGSSSPTSYNTDAQQCDQFMWNNKNFLIFFAAGNDNTDEIRVASYGVAKNMVTVGATETGFGYNSTTYSNPGSTDGNDPENMAEFSSHGPTDEGLMKPNVSVPGGWYIWSADNIDGGSSCHTGLRYMGGTSMATPTCAGMTALIRQYFMAGYYPTGDVVAGDALTPSGALMKAMLILGTRNMTGIYTIDAVNNTGSKRAPSNGQGWGRVVLDDCMYFNDSYGADTRKLWVKNITSGFTSTGQTHTYWLYTGPSTTENIKIVLSFTDYPGSPAVGISGVNDLNLTVTVAGNTYKGNVFSSTVSRSVTGGSYDGINRDEVVWLDPIPNSLIEITIGANAIRTSPQPYALVAAGDLSEAPPNEAPEVPALNKLFDNERTLDRTPTFEWLVPIDDDGDPLHFRLQLDDAPDFASIIGEVATNVSAVGFTGGPFPVTEGTSAVKTYTVQSNLTQGQTYWWRMCAYDGVNYSAWTTPRSFTVDTLRPRSDWFQTTTDQFATNTVSSVQVTSPGSVSLAPPTNTVIQVPSSCINDYYTAGEANEWYSRWTIPGSGTVTVTRLWFYDGNGSISSSESIKMALYYDGSGNNKIAASEARIYGTGTTGWLSADVTTPFELTLGNTYWVGVASQSGTTNRIYRDQYANCADYPPTGSANYSYYSTNDYNLNSTVPLTSQSSQYKYTIPGITYVSGSNTGNILSTRIDYSSVSGAVGWNAIEFSDNETTGDLKYQVLYDVAGTPTLIPDAALSGNSTGFDTSPINLSALNTTTYNRLYLKANLTNSGGSPILNDWAVTWRTEETLALEVRKGGAGGPLYSTSSWAIGRLDEGQVIIMTAGDYAYIKNTGTVAIDLRLKAETSGWSLGNATGEDIALLMGLFDTSAPDAIDFSSPTDVLNGTFKLSGSTEAGAFATSAANGFNITVDTGRSLYLYFQAPSPNTFTTMQTITVTIEAIAHM